MTQHRRTTPLAHTCEAPHSCSRSLRLEVLSQAPYFIGLTPAEVTAIDERMYVRGYTEGETVYRSGETATHLFILATGRVKVSRSHLDGSNVLVDVITAGTMFGSVAALGNSVYPDTADALTVSCALRISASDFRAILQKHPHVALAVLDDVAARLEHAHQAVRRLSGGTVEQRVAATLLRLADKLGEPRGDTILLQLPLSRADLAAMTGTTSESVSRALSKLHREGIIDTGRRWTAITGMAQLAKVAQG